MIVLANEILDGRADQRPLQAIDIMVRRNAFGRQVDSFETDLQIAGIDWRPGARECSSERRGWNAPVRM